MSGSEAIRGFYHQFLWALEAIITELEQESTTVTAVRVESTKNDSADFVLMAEDVLTLAVQAKSTIGTSLTLPEALGSLSDLVRTEARSYQLLTNRALTEPTRQLAGLLQAGVTAGLRERITSLLQPDHPMAKLLNRADDETWRRLAKCRIAFDPRDRVDLHTSIRERVRALRRRLHPATRVGWELAGLLTGHLLVVVQERAADPGEKLVLLSEARSILGIGAAELLAITARREWSANVNLPPRLGDVARNKALERIAVVLATPIRTLSSPVCVLAGLSGIGKSCLAAAWAADRADSYDVVFWIDAASDGLLVTSFQAVERWCAQVWGLEAVGSNVQKRVLSALAASARPWLMVFDNAVDQNRVASWLPTSGLGHVLVTTTDQTAWHGSRVSRILVDPMDLPEATRLLTLRLDGADPQDAKSPELKELANRLLRWPLALELCAAYINTCLGGIKGLAAYYELMPRSLADEHSVPVGYPATLVQAILMLWHRMERYRDEGGPREVAFKVLRIAAFLHPGQIPLHLIAACVLLDPVKTSEQNLNGPLVISSGSLPLPEVAREMARYGLAVADLPLGWSPNQAITPTSVEFTVSMNEIVQMVLRDQIEHEGLDEAVLSQLAFFLQLWISGLIETERARLAVQLVPHAYAVAERCLTARIVNGFVALLWGNTAGLLTWLEDWGNAERYLRAELAWLRQPPGSPLAHIKTIDMLIQVLACKPDWPASAPETVVLLEEILEALPLAAEVNPSSTLDTVEHLLAMIVGIEEQVRDESRIAQIRAALTDYEQSSGREEGRSLPAQVGQVEELVNDGRLDDAEFICAELLPRVADPILYFDLLRLMVEILGRKRQWGRVADFLDHFCRSIDDGVVPTLAVANLVRNVSLTCFPFAHQSGARWVLNYLSQMVDRFHATGRRFRSADTVYVSICRGVAAALLGDVGSCERFVSLADSADARLVAGDRGEPLWTGVLDLLVRWQSVAVASESAGRGMTNLVERRPEPSHVGNDLPGLPPDIPGEAAQLYGVLLAQLAVRDDSATTPQYACEEAVRVLGLLQHEAFVGRTKCVVARFDSENEAKVVNVLTDHSLIVSVKAVRVADPAVLRLLGERETAGLTGPRIVVSPPLTLADRQLKVQPVIVRPPLILAYSLADGISGDVGSSNSIAAVQPDDFGIAMHGLICDHLVRGSNS